MDADTDVDVAMNDEVSDTWMEMKRNVRALEKDSERDWERTPKGFGKGLRKGLRKGLGRTWKNDSEK